MNTRTQTFSVIIPTRDRASVFVTALKSVLAQQYRDFEVIVVDDGSSIEQNRIYRKLTAPVGAKLLTLDPKSNGYGPSFARNYGAAHTRGHCCPVKQAMSADKGMILNAVLAI
jgi:glycosyltransferase involved in cell wall biosynthesis